MMRTARWCLCFWMAAAAASVACVDSAAESKACRKQHVPLLVVKREARCALQRPGVSMTVPQLSVGTNEGATPVQYERQLQEDVAGKPRQRDLPCVSFAGAVPHPVLAQRCACACMVVQGFFLVGPDQRLGARGLACETCQGATTSMSDPPPPGESPTYHRTAFVPRGV